MSTITLGLSKKGGVLYQVTTDPIAVKRVTNKSPANVKNDQGVTITVTKSDRMHDVPELRDFETISLDQGQPLYVCLKKPGFSKFIRNVEKVASYLEGFIRDVVEFPSEAIQNSNGATADPMGSSVDTTNAVEPNNSKHAPDSSSTMSAGNSGSLDCVSDKNNKSNPEGLAEEKVSIPETVDTSNQNQKPVPNTSEIQSVVQAVPAPGQPQSCSSDISAAPLAPVKESEANITSEPSRNAGSTVNPSHQNHENTDSTAHDEFDPEALSSAQPQPSSSDSSAASSASAIESEAKITL